MALSDYKNELAQTAKNIASPGKQLVSCEHLMNCSVFIANFV